MLETLCPHCQSANRLNAERLEDNPRCGKCKSRLLDGEPIAADDSFFRRLLEREGLPLVVDFWASWCGPCRMMAPVFAQAAGQWQTKARFIKVDTEKAVQSAARFQIRSIPTVMIFKGGSPVAQQAGAMTLPQLTQWLNSHLRSA
ncbi:MAG: thioredoxin TrxC [Porticoccaceae bacterium]|nr:thioredoxin TrxC [Porticoccaceae bacterium]